MEEAAAAALAERQLAIEAVTVQPSSAAAGSELQAELQSRAVELEAEVQARAAEVQAARAECEALREELRAATEAAATSTAQEVERATGELLAQSSEARRQVPHPNPNLT